MTDSPTRQQIDRLLLEVYTEEGCGIWWTSLNRSLALQTPAELWYSGKASARDRVLAEAERLAGGAW